MRNARESELAEVGGGDDRSPPPEERGKTARFMYKVYKIKGNVHGPK